MKMSKLQLAAEEYFAANSYMSKRVLQDIIDVRESYEDAWFQLDHREQEEAINEQIIMPEVRLKNVEPPRPEFVSFPRLRMKTGQKIIQDEDKAGNQIKYRDEHSAPFSWKTRSQQDLALDMPRRGSTTSSEDPASEGLTLVAARRSAILSCPFGKVPKTAIPVPIPVVPGSVSEPSRLAAPALASRSREPRPAPPGENDEEAASALRIEDVTSLVSSIVIATDDTLVLDFSTPFSSAKFDCSTESTLSTGSSTPREETSLLSRVKDKTLNLKRSLTPTLRRKKSITSTDTQSTFAGDYDSCNSSDFTPTRVAPRGNSSRSSSVASTPRPSVPPPPPPAALRPPPISLKSAVEEGSVGPPRPPARAPTTRISSLHNEEIHQQSASAPDKGSLEGSVTADQPSADEQDDASATTPIPKTGFDFLDDW